MKSRPCCMQRDAAASERRAANGARVRVKARRRNALSIRFNLHILTPNAEALVSGFDHSAAAAHCWPGKLATGLGQHRDKADRLATPAGHRTLSDRVQALGLVVVFFEPLPHHLLVPARTAALSHPAAAREVSWCYRRTSRRAIAWHSTHRFVSRTSTLISGTSKTLAASSASSSSPAR